MAIRVRTDGTSTSVENVATKGVTIVKKVTVGKPVRKVNAAVTSIDNIRGVDTSGKEDGFILVYNESTDTWETRSNSASSNINTLGGVDTTTKTNGSVLVYNSSTENFEATIELQEQTINGGQY